MKEEVAEEKRQFLLQLEEERAHLMEETPRAENAKINVTDEPYFGTYILCNYLPFSKADKGAQGGPQQHETPKHSPTDISKRLRS